MLDLVGNPENRFYRVAAHMFLCCSSSDYSDTKDMIMKLHTFVKHNNYA